MRVIETFGPTIQGEGPYAGRVCHFVRFGGCDYRCSWCDSIQAVDPALVRTADDLTPHEIVDQLLDLAPAPMLVLSGGNPALQRLDALLDLLRPMYQVIAVETQGSIWRDWLTRVDSLVVSPKPPSSHEATPAHWHQFIRFMVNATQHPGLVLKVVCFDEADLDWVCRGVLTLYPNVPLYLSVGTDPEDTPSSLGDRYAWLCETVTGDTQLHGAVVLPQLHVIAWGHRVGV